ncbi:MAG: hypothetical protein ABSC50_15110 [Candidatus Bathyarchaeia archaeon]
MVIEPSAAAAVATLIEKAKTRAAEKVVVVVSGGNISLKMTEAMLSKYH